jgi:endonuclease/exonuclease/phosphatase family metal-dependent hydrolase
MLDACRNLDGELVLMGDFNSTPALTGTLGRHERLVARIESEFGLVSAYHAKCGEARGRESAATLWRGKTNPKPFHIDYCFVPAGWVPRIRCIEVGTYADWRDSDHRPLMVDVDLE